MAKVFEGEISKALHGMDIYCHKCPDHPHAIPDKVDFLAALPPRGRFIALEAKETKNETHVPASILTPNQRACLERVDRCGGLSLVVINFDRRRGIGGRVGFAIAYRWQYLPAPGEDFLIAEGDLIARVRGGWDLSSYLQQFV